MTHITFRTAGAGSPILLLHAFPLNAAMWTGQMSSLADIGSFLAPDLPGFGDSDQADPVNDLDALAGILYEDARSRGVEQAVVAGCSMGGYLAFALLRGAPHFVRGLVLINSRAAADTEPGRATRLDLARRVEREGCGFLVDEWPPGALSASSRARADVVGQVKSMIAQATPGGVIAAQQAMAKRLDSAPLLAGIRFPVLVIHGLDDRLIIESEARAMAAAIPGAQFYGVPAAGHLPNLEQPSLVNAALRDFMSRLFSPP